MSDPVQNPETPATDAPSARSDGTFVVKVNDAAHAVAPGATLHSLLQALTLAEKPGLAVALGDDVVPREQWPRKVLRDGDAILVIQASQGG